MKPATLTDLMYAVIHDEDFDDGMFSHDVLRLLEIALKKKLGLAALCSPVRVDLGNGHILNITVENNTPQPIQELRPEVHGFAMLMEQRLREKDSEKGQGWKRKKDFDLVTDAFSKCSQIQSSIINCRLAVPTLAADLGNIAMFIADIYGALEDEVKLAQYERQIIEGN